MSTATLPRAIGGEWLKLRSVRSTVWSLIAFVTVTVGISALIGAVVSNQWGAMNPGQKASFTGMDASTRGMVLGQLVLGVLGVLAVTGEYSSGTIRATLAAVPRRITALSAKTLVFAAVAAVFSAVTVFTAFFLTQSIVTSTGRSAGIGDPGVLRAVLGGVLYLVLLGIIAVGIGTIVRSTAAGITSMVGLVFVLPLIANFLPGTWSQSVGKWLPMSLSQSLTQPVHDAASLPWGGAAAMMVVYAAAAIAVGGFFLVRRDA
jgi:ABC-type transport system involved in multi-copper enzyme maturation permease subunit